MTRPAAGYLAFLVAALFAANAAVALAVIPRAWPAYGRAYSDLSPWSRRSS